MLENGARLDRRGPLAIAAFWTGLGVFDAMQTVVVMRSEGMHHAWPVLFAVIVISWLPWAVATPLVGALARRVPPARFRSPQTWLAHLSACAAVALTSAAWTAFLHAAFNPYADPRPPGVASIFADNLLNNIVSSLILYVGILTVYEGLRSAHRLAAAQTETARLNEGLAQARLSALRNQVEPHFLFNALSGVAALVREGRDADAVDAIATLGDLLRRTLDNPSHEVPLREELDVLNDYLKIQTMRFGARLALRIDVPEEFLGVPVPNLILQPIVENAIKHGIARRANGGAIAISASAAGDRLILRVRNDGPPLADVREPEGGIGLANLRSRLRGLYGDAFGLVLRDDGAGVEASVTLPLRAVPVGR